MTKTSLLLISIAVATLAAVPTADAKIVFKAKTLSRGGTVMLNPQPLPPAAKLALNPQPLPPRR